MAKAFGDFRRIEREFQELSHFHGIHAASKHLFHQRTQSSRGVVDHMLQLLVFAMNVADHMHRAFGQRLHSGQPSNLGNRRVNIRVLHRQQFQHGEIGFRSLKGQRCVGHWGDGLWQNKGE